jgi:large subunit ribosomal protein L22
MGKTTAPRSLADNEAKAYNASIRTSPQKLNLVAQSIRGLTADKALAQLTFSKRRVAHEVRKVLQSAIANAENNHDLDVDDLVVSEASVGKNLVMKRFHARARGNSGGIEKFFSQITIIVEEKREEAPAADDAKAAAPAKSSKGKAAKKTSGKAPAKKPVAKKAKKETA